ncbi:DUF805 domain-containing protein [Macrococcus brunensis]|uniref:DUF805 domain-containing protein n=1 Tax=Macrococcus brunensis TaxID=198483 RepID=UPI001EF1148E|nr:DUF805 domain-containing protein [Macrococcus brunensis]ULG73702.1 DUF805 domain-containing protein [Macrococcus brunensis]
MTWIEAYKRFWQNAFKMKGRARRKEFWIPQLLNTVISRVIELIFTMGGATTKFSIRMDEEAIIDYGSLIWLIVILIPSFTVTARRLQDININGWWAVLPIFGWYIALGSMIAILIIPGVVDYLSQPERLTAALTTSTIIGVMLAVMSIVFFVFNVMDGNPRPNKYGEDPKKKERYFYKGEI